MKNDRIIGQVKRVNGPVIEVTGITDAMMYELVRVSEEKLIGEIIKLENETAVVQVYENTTGIAPGDPVYGAGIELSLELGPGMIGTIYDGIQRPLEDIRKISEIYIERGISVPSLNRDKKWHFIPAVQAGDRVSGGAVLGTVQETERIEHKILVPPSDSGVIESVASEGDYTVEEPVAVIRNGEETKELFLMHRWPIRVARPVKQRQPLDIPLITGQRVLDTLFPCIALDDDRVLANFDHIGGECDDPVQILSVHSPVGTPVLHVRHRGQRDLYGLSIVHIADGKV